MISVQSIMSLFALVLLSKVTLSTNHSIIDSFKNMLEIQGRVSALAEANNLLDEISSKDYDQTKGVKPAEFTPSSLLGPDGSETYPNFNDVDDYNRLKRTIPSSIFSNGLALTVSVSYVNPLNTVQVSTAPTMAKRVDLLIFNSALGETLKIQQVFYH